MGKAKSCIIKFKDGQELHRPGETISGVATLEIEGDLTVRKISIFCRGQTLTKWTRLNQKSYEKDAEASEIYIYKVIRAHTANPPAVMQAGQYSYNFRFQLPDNCPSSFEGTYGATRYCIRVEVDKPFPSINQVFERSFTVLAHLDVNDPAYRRPVSASAQKCVSKVLGIGNAGTLSVSASLDRTGYCPGEKICINLEAKNQSSKDLGHARATLIQKADYVAGAYTNDHTCKIRALEGDKIERERISKWTDQMLMVDAVPPSSKAQTCHIMKVSYYIKVEVEIPLARDLELLIPIVIGTTPLGTSVPSQPRHIGGNLYLTDRSRTINYVRCKEGVERFSKTSSGFPIIPSSLPLTAYVPDYNREQALAKLAASASATATAASSATNTHKVASSALARATAPPPTPTTPVPSKEAQASLPVLQVMASTPIEAPPTYEEACANQLNTTSPPVYTVTGAGHGSVLMILFPREDSSLVYDSIKQNMPSLLLHCGQVLALVPEMQVLPSEETSAFLIQFGSQNSALGWLQAIALSHKDLSTKWWALVSENKEHRDNSRDFSQYKSLSVSLLKRNAEFKHTKSYSDEYMKLLKEALKPCKEKLGVYTILSGKVVFALGDWSSFPAKASELTFVVNKLPSLENYRAYKEQFQTDSGVKRFHELLLMCYTYIFCSAFDVADISQFQTN